jgi:hypothetical protein
MDNKSKKLSKKVSFSLSKKQSVRELEMDLYDYDCELRMIRVLIDNLEEKMLLVEDAMNELKTYLYRFHDIPETKSTKSSSRYSTPLCSPRDDD